jgi:hypothetical protein
VSTQAYAALYVAWVSLSQQLPEYAKERLLCLPSTWSPLQPIPLFLEAWPCLRIGIHCSCWCREGVLVIDACWHVPAPHELLQVCAKGYTVSELAAECGVARRDRVRCREHYDDPANRVDASSRRR